MSGGGGGRSDDWPSSGSGSKGGGAGGGTGGATDPCMIVRRGSINSPKAAVLNPLKVGDVLAVSVDQSGARPILIVSHNNIEAGSLTFLGYLDIIKCIVDYGKRYRAVIENISGGNYAVRVEPI